MDKLLSRNEFRNLCLQRDSNLCVFCKSTENIVVHHIIERRLWPDGGYYIENGASVCEPCHLLCERTVYSVEQVREACGITKKVIPPHLYPDQTYDKWGNPVLPNGQRLKGELFFDQSVQKVLAEGNALELFVTWVKYPRTHHVPWSEGLHDDDRLIDSLSVFEGQRVIVTEKMDGENTTMYNNHIHARSVESEHHPSRSWVKNFWSGIRADIPDGWRICGENLYAKHSIGYDSLPTYFMGFSIWNDKNICLSWDDTLTWFELFGITPVPVLYDGIFNVDTIKKLYNSKEDWDKSEGYVVRVADDIGYGEFRHKVGKFVRKGHVQTTKHWMRGQPIEKNFLKNE